MTSTTKTRTTIHIWAGAEPAKPAEPAATGKPAETVESESATLYPPLPDGYRWEVKWSKFDSAYDVAIEWDLPGRYAGSRTIAGSITKSPTSAWFLRFRIPKLMRTLQKFRVEEAKLAPYYPNRGS